MSAYTIYEFNTGERLRTAMASEVAQWMPHEESEDRAERLYDGAIYGLPGHKVWIDVTKSKSIVGVSSLGTPIFAHYEYMATFEDGGVAEVDGRVAARFERDLTDGRIQLREGYAAGGRYGFPGRRVSIIIPDDEPSLPPPAIQAVWLRETVF